MKIFIDAGHGGKNPGAIGPNGLHEADVNLDIALKLGRILSKWGYEIEYSRTMDITLTLSERAKMANDWGANYFVSIHCNSNVNPEARGTSTYFYKTRTIAESFAKTVNNNLVRQIELKDLGIFSANFAVLRLTRMPAILVETAFISNPYEASLLATNSFRQNCAIGIANGIAEFTT
ncbi:N-acetylmuramoyl-L-alanine amidase family protein [[Clostridium] colinum]|uniref:N-acetylmuramoyl-L-alanine amidase family protein n=1 Tax=[Clostridium] colinum TaxID=36835 RepID=UPI0020249E23|nr:N-acetylmuramoyl-L-alanine amidase [[Clostridium] colinum]